MELKYLTLEEFKVISERAHFLCFQEQRDASMNTFDFAILVTENEIPIGYGTFIELSKDSLYMQHGGVFEPIEKSLGTVRAYHLILRALAEKYKDAATRIANTNKAMLKLAISAGFLVTGINVNDDIVFVNLHKVFKE